MQPHKPGGDEGSGTDCEKQNLRSQLEQTKSEKMMRTNPPKTGLMSTCITHAFQLPPSLVCIDLPIAAYAADKCPQGCEKAGNNLSGARVEHRHTFPGYTRSGLSSGMADKRLP
jgi:hypothetical protein